MKTKEKTKDLTMRQATELSDLQEHIIKNVAERKWNKDQLSDEIDKLYLLGLKHGNELASVLMGMVQNITK